MTKRKPKTNPNSNKLNKIAAVVFSLFITFGLIAYKFLPEVKTVLLSESSKKEETQKSSETTSELDTKKHFDLKGINESSISVITSNNSNVAVNSNNVSNSNNVINHETTDKYSAAFATTTCSAKYLAQRSEHPKVFCAN